MENLVEMKIGALVYRCYDMITFRSGAPTLKEPSKVQREVTGMLQCGYSMQLLLQIHSFENTKFTKENILNKIN